MLSMIDEINAVASRRAHPSAALLRALLDYDPQTGALTWKPRTPEMFMARSQTNEHACKVWNARFAGKPALTAMDSDGYRHGSIYDRLYRAHRIIYMIVHGVWPENVDHEDGNPENNRIDNLRAATCSENRRNSGIGRNNRSGAHGVSKRACKWHAQMTLNEKYITLGTFDSFDDAVAARRAAEIKHNFHSNHGARLSFAARKMLDRDTDNARHAS